jgi:hypothetical protein
MNLKQQISLLVSNKYSFFTEQFVFEIMPDNTFRETIKKVYKFFSGISVDFRCKNVRVNNHWKNYTDFWDIYKDDKFNQNNKEKYNYLLNSRVVEMLVTRYALSQHESRDNYNEGCISSESITYWQAMFCGARFLDRHYEQTRGQLYRPTSQRTYLSVRRYVSKVRHQNKTGWQPFKDLGKASE